MRSAKSTQNISKLSPIIDGGGLEGFVERLFYQPSPLQKALSSFLTPFAYLYGSAMWLRRRLRYPKAFSVPIISVGNLVVGGSGKTPFVCALASRFEGVWIVSRGYGRDSKGLIQVSKEGKILVTVEASGDEAMEMALALPKASVVVAENRTEGIDYAIKEGAQIVLLDDGFNRVEIKKFEILLEPETILNRRVLPAGAFREFPSTVKYADLYLKEGRDYRRKVTICNPGSRMILATSIARPQRLTPWLPKTVVGTYRVPDHHRFNIKELESIQ